MRLRKSHSFNLTGGTFVPLRPYCLLLNQHKKQQKYSDFFNDIMVWTALLHATILDNYLIYAKYCVAKCAVTHFLCIFVAKLRNEI
jgi:hypothetical protein